MEELKAEIRQFVTNADAPLVTLVERLCQALQSHPEALEQLSGSYRLQTRDTGVNVGFALGKGSFRLLKRDEQADAAILGTEHSMLALLHRELNPMTAMLTGKLQVKGSMQLLRKFAQVL